MDVLLSHGYFLQDDPVEQEVMKPYPPLGLLYLSSFLKGRGFSIDVFDSTFASPAEFEARVRDARPPIVGLSANLMTRARIVAMIRVCRSLGSWIVVGGPEPANYPDRYLECGADVVVDGEGEETLEELLRHRMEGRPGRLKDVSGIIFRQPDGQLVRTAPRPRIRDLDSFPLPDREALDQRRYVRVWRRRHGRGSVSIITSRGCPYTCTWCSHGVFGFSYRSRSPQNVADEVELIARTYQPDMLWYSDDVFTINRRWLFSYSRELQKRGLRIPFETISREDCLDAEVIQELARMGCFRLWIGAESGSQKILDRMQRRTRASRVVEMVRLLQDNGIQAGLFIMLGYEGEEKEDIEETLRFLKAASPDRFLTTVAYPIKGTPFFEGVEGRIPANSRWEESSDRNLDFEGRYSRGFYRLANRWIHNEMSLHREGQKERPSYFRMLKSFTASRAGRLGMLAPWNQSR